MIILEVKGLNKSFGGVKAVDDVSFTVATGELSAIIGPNGAGKTTLFHLISGYHNSDTGRVLFEGEDITKKSADWICRRGISRSFQIIAIFPKLTVFRNVQIAVLSQLQRTLNFFSSSDKLARNEVMQLLQSVGLADQADFLAGSLSQGDQKRLEFAITLANKPKLLLLDEPTAGMSPIERTSTIELIGKLVRERGLTAVFTEHDMDMVFGISEKIRVMHFGRLIADARPDEIRNNELVQKVYLGEV